MFCQTSAVELAVLDGAESVDGFVLVELVGHRHFVASLVGAVGSLGEGCCLLLEQVFSASSKLQEACLLVDSDAELVGREASRTASIGDFHFEIFLWRHCHHLALCLWSGLSFWPLRYSDYLRRIECDLHLIVACLSSQLAVLLSHCHKRCHGKQGR